MIIDIIIGVALIASIVTGIVRGFAKEISVLAGLIFGLYIASQKYLALEKYLFHSSPVSTTYKVISFIIIFIIVFIVFLLLGLLLRKIIQLIMLGWLDKILGGIFGFIKGLIIIWLILMLVTTIFPNTINIISKSKLALQILEYGANFTKLPVKVKTYRKLLTNLTNTNILIQKHMPVMGLK
jgi:membrane protein required for colicin V production